MCATATMTPQCSHQDATRCNICETRQPAKHCGVCRIHLCENCVRKHLSDKSQKHDIIAFPKRFKSHPRVLAKVKTHIGKLSNVSCSNKNDNEIWICGTCDEDDKGEISLYNLKGNFLQGFTTKCNPAPWDMVVTRSGKLAFSDPEARSIYMHTADNKQTQTLIKLTDWTPYNICSTSFDDLIVVMRKGVETKLVRFTGSTERQSIQFAETDKPLFSSTSQSKCLCENMNLDICVADLGAHAVVVVSATGNLRFRYTGPPSLKLPFKPVGITTDSQSMILTSDSSNNQIHILNEDGTFLRNIKKCKIDSPNSLCVDSKDNLFVGERFSGKVKKIQYYKSK